MGAVILREVQASHSGDGTGERTRRRMIVSAVQLLAERGVAGTSFREVVERAGAPRGSIYFHFRGGKRELVEEAVQLAGARSIGVMEANIAEGGGPAALLNTIVGFYRELLLATDCAAGCPVAAVASESHTDPELAALAAEVFASWRRLLVETIVEHGVASEEDAPGLAELAIAAIEGALVVCRAERSVEPLDRVERELERLVGLR